MSLVVPKFVLENKFDYSNGAPGKQLNESSWRYLFEGGSGEPNSPESTDDPFYKEQLPWLTLYKTHKDLLQIKLVTTVAYVETTNDPNDPAYSIEAAYIKGFPLMLQGPKTQFDDKNNISADCWEYNWPFYYQHVETLSTDVSNNVTNWDNFNAGNTKVIYDMKTTQRRNLIILDLNHDDFVLKNNGNGQNRFIDPTVKNYNSKERPEYLVVRLDSAIEESSFVYTDQFGPEAGRVVDNQYFNNGTNSSPKLYVFNYVYSGYVISPYDFMSAFTTDYLRGQFVLTNTSFNGYVNKDLNNTNSPNIIQVNSKFYSSTHSIKDGWDNSRKNKHQTIKTPYYYNIFLRIPELSVEDISGTIINNGTTDPDRFNTIGYSPTSLSPSTGTGINYGIEKLFWCSLTSPRHTVYSGDVNNGKQKAFIGNYLNVNEVEASYDNGQRVFDNPNADYMPKKNYIPEQTQQQLGSLSLDTEAIAPLYSSNYDRYTFSISGSGTQADPWTGNSLNGVVTDGDHYSQADIFFKVTGSGTVYINTAVSSEVTPFDVAHLYVDGDLKWQQAGNSTNQYFYFPSQGTYQSYELEDGDQIRFFYRKDGSVDRGYDQQTYSIYFVPEQTEQAVGIVNTSFEACGYIEREIREQSVKYSKLTNQPTYSGKNEINMARKTLTPYYHYPSDAQGENATEAYAFLYPDDQTWTDYNTSNTNIITDTSGVDITNCEVIELRNLIEFTDNTVINIDISLNKTSTKFQNSGKKTITFVTSGNTIYGDATEAPIWKSNRKLINNSVKSKYNATDMRTLYRINEDGYRISFNYQDNANTQKHIYVMDIASGSYLVREDDINIFSSKDDSNGAAVDTFINSLDWGSHKELVSFRANVYQIKLNQSSDNGTIERQNNEFLNFSLDGDQQQVSIYNEPHFYVNDANNEIRNPIFAYFNFYGITSSEFIGGIDWHRGEGTNGTGAEPNNINIILRKFLTGVNSGNRKRFTDSPYLLLIDKFRFRNQFKDSSRLYFNSNIFYGATSFEFSNVYAKTSINDTYNQTSVLLIDKTAGPSNPEWRNVDHKNHGLDITTISNNEVINNETNIRIFIARTGIDLFTGTLLGKFGINERTLLSTTNNNNAPSCVELNNGIDISFNGVSVKYDCFNFYKTAFVASQKNLFISDYWLWKERLTTLTIPGPEYIGRIPVGFDITDRTLNNRYNVYNWKSNDVPSNLYPTGFIHNPLRAYENQSLINFSIEVSTISFNVSHLLINTWSGNIDINNNINSNAVVGLSSFANSSGGYDIIKGSPKLNIQGGLTISPPINDRPVYLKFDITGQLNFATDTNPGNTTEEEKSKAPSEILEIGGTTPIDLGTDIFGKPNTDTTPGAPDNGGWFTFDRDGENSGSNDILNNRNGIFVPMAIDDGTGTIATPAERFYSTIDFNSNSLAIAPTNITINTNIYPQYGGFSKEEEAFPLELLFCYPYNIPDDKKPDKIITTYNNSDGVQTTQTFDNYKGNKRFSKLYALKITGDNIIQNNLNFRDRSIFPETILVNCVELPPPKQVNNFNDMLASDNSEVKLVWKGYNFDFSSGNARSQLGNVGNIRWKIERFQTQLEINTTIFNDIIEPDGGNNPDGFNLSTYTYIDKNIRIYDKYKYTISGTYVYNFVRKKTDTNIYTLEMPFGSFTTDEIIVCKNNKFEYGRYNTTSTNLKLYRPLLLTTPEGQKDEYGKKSGGVCPGNIFSGSTRISSSQNIYANTSNQLTKKQTYVLLSKQRFRPFR